MKIVGITCGVLKDQYHSKNYVNVDYVNAIIKAGAKAIAIHGRTKTDMYSGTVNYDLIKQVKERHPDFPIIANGDIRKISIQ